MSYHYIDIDAADIAANSSLLQEILDECDINELIDYCKSHVNCKGAFHKDNWELAAELISLCQEKTSNIWTKQDVLDAVNELLDYTTLK